ncbi:DUF1189 domain-containing protein [Evansella clarkii]|uniref:DUF1189 domain-containing protein n=1 Tax=Evansella clarkii TaxID=79879 RepID=UPI000996DFE8|nr:DUF1189 domain-containing protein [Evansella clarkii]
MNIFQQFFKSLYSPSTISKFRFQKIGKSILYVFFLMLIATIPAAVILGVSLSSVYNSAERHLTETFPEFEIQNGVLTAETDEPIIIEEDGELIIFDPTGELNPNDLAGARTAIGLFEREAAIVTDGIPQSAAYNEININITSNELAELLESVGGVLPLIISFIIVLMYIFSTGMKFIGIFSLSFIALLMKNSMAPQLKYRHCWVLAAYTVTLPTILFALLEAMQIFIPFSFTLYWVTAIAMMYFVLKEIPVPNRSTDGEDLRTP